VKHEETKLQITVVHYLRLVHPDLMWFSVPNGGYVLDKRTASLLKATGLRAGVPDLAFVLPGAIVKFIELKTAKGTLSDEQAVVINALRRLGCEVEICRSLDAVIATLAKWDIKGRTVRQGEL